jgi:hypothetical protein
MLSSAGKFLTDAFEKLQSASDFLPSSSGGTVLNAAAANSKNSTTTALAVSSSAAGAGGLINTDSEAFHILKKAFGITAASAAVIGTAYYIGY